MKFLIPLMILFAHAAFAQPGQVVYIDSLSPEGLLLQKGWQWQASDGSWISVDPTKDIQDSIPLMVKEKVGVIRLYLSLSQKLKNIPLIIQIQHSVAGQYYLNGQKIAEFGKLSQDPNEVIAKDPYWQPIVFPLRGDTLNLLEVHFAVQPDIHYTTVFETANPLVSIYLYDANKGQQLYTSTLVNYNRFEYLLSGICLIIFIIHIAFYLLYKEAIANLYFALSRIVYLAGAVLQNTYWFYLGAVEQKYWIGNIAFAVFVLSFILTMVSAIYYLKRKLDWIDKIFIALYFPVIACIFLMYPNGWRIAAAFEVLIIFNLMRIAILHRKVHKMDATVIGLGAFITLIFFALFVASGTFHNNNFLLSLDSQRMIYYIIHALALPVSISIFLAKNFSTMAIRLKKEISHNEMLSTEKQKILAEQNQTLERQVAERTLELSSKNRELEIEAALERVRARTLSMQVSNEVLNVAATLYDELQKLDFTYGIIGINFINGETGVTETWVAGFGQDNYPKSYSIPYFDHPYQKRMIEAWRNGTPYLVYELTGSEKKDFDDFMFTHSDYRTMPEDVKARMIATESVTFSLAYMKYGVLLWGAATPLSIPLPEEKAQIFRRFAKVFEQVYTRFLDLQKAEAQAKEAQIEAALERVRSRTMAMQKSEELQKVTLVLYEQLKNLGFNFGAASITLMDADTGDTEWWLEGFGVEYQFLEKYHVKYFDHPGHMEQLEHWRKGIPYAVIEVSGDEKKTFDKFIFNETDFARVPEQTKKFMMQYEAVKWSMAYMQFGALSWSPSPLSNEQANILQRFAKVFEQTYTRFLDLQKAEAQAREALIEAALEKIRSRSLAMFRSEELKEVMEVMLQKTKELDVAMGSIAIQFFDDETKDSDFWVSNDIQHISKIKQPYDAKIMSGNNYMVDCWEAKNKGENIINKHYTYEQKNEWFDYVFAHNDLDAIPQVARDFIREAPNQVCNLILEKHSALFADNWFGQNYSPEKLDTLKRIAKVFDQAYTRFLDLQKSEKQAQEAILEASLERVRAEIASMRTPADLQRITPLIWKELITLKLPFIRCGVFIVEEDSQKVYTYLSTPEGEALASFHLAFESEGITPGLVKHWRSQHIFLDHWSEEQFRTWAQNLVTQGLLQSTENFLSIAPPQQLYLHFVPFLQGMIYVGNSTPLNQEQIQVVQQLANAFSGAYARYQDFTQLETAKLQVEHTLTTLKATQAQLIQSEKLASLGELTAGIAHEIQNPLNFVNNFAEVSAEMLDEMHEELEKGDTTEAIAIATDLKTNLEKINHHGQRASSIVKGMLEHSRASTGVKEPTDLNALADEYLRLAYHGLRAKDNNFNATMETHFDPDLPLVSVIPQDIGRVLLNLINNAFWAIHQRDVETLHATSLQEPQYQPTVTISTQKTADQIIISVQDNGPGIPESIRDKIFQPFFTTKPTGQGTGLGLSLAYDIIKAHGGSLDVESKVGEGTTFIIRLV
ncbi:MAG: ATP-binding protein [Haliscomenobacter sp.]|uniref:ATP-binding protein n=1 Tax=Haliscomenobacter sp. TaxID=2717303 RepID=UPI0029B2A8D4|nr:ATP-binding protein [Haliscomenobacter sp.]MDX2071586.1 ATP-binding protein [Haliscomenobacter sp.]